MSQISYICFHVFKEMRFVFIFLFSVLIFFHSKAQQWEVIDSIALSHDGNFSSVGDLALSLTATVSDPKDKARVIFRWITHHVRYDLQQLKNPSAKTKLNVEAGDLEKELVKIDSIKSYQTAKFKKGICHDYSILFKNMCTAAGIECVYLIGQSRDFINPFSKSRNSDHAWNAIKINDRWHLVDCTWGAGYVLNGRYHKRFGDGYFMSDSKLFAIDHLPKNASWQLLDRPLTMDQFMDQSMYKYSNRNLSITKLETISLTGKPTYKIKFYENPGALLVKSARGKDLKFESRIEGDYIILTILSPVNNHFQLLGSKSLRNRKYELIGYLKV